MKHDPQEAKILARIRATSKRVEKCLLKLRARKTRTKPQIPTLQQIADAYGITRVRLYDLQVAADIPRETLLDPDAMFIVLLGRYSSPLRTRLSDPAERQRIKTILTEQE